jgi:hypothetical protein
MVMGGVWRVRRLRIVWTTHTYVEVSELEVDAGTDEIEPCTSFQVYNIECEVGKGGPQNDRLFEERVLEMKDLDMQSRNWMLMERVNLVWERAGLRIFANAEGFQVWKSQNRTLLDHPCYVLIDVEVLRQIKESD